ncbi:arylamine N-acetyltransferase [Paenibacillus sp. J5C_2022]|uniref:arylamine N-acetyltransferase family protein n=1 Tax=Paenibacillus sp. J5C2022 TaxID=2977129 RepID=UPI0021D274B6|nr:arylamine N-acetyltransferase [Paenibacillus sp. J5C2022]MCU6710007.1 arylamine N-acetyltransferase [Paenibacillus sp. J5C2022]
MHALNERFRERIGFQGQSPISFQELPHLLERAGLTLPFENTAVVAKQTTPISKESLIEKIVNRREGGLCYELNMLLYYFLLENGFQAKLLSAIVYKHDEGVFFSLGRTHVTVLLTHEGREYVIDTGFGGNLPLVPVPMSGETVCSGNGAFRIAPANLEQGNYVMEMKLLHKHEEWRVGYAFDTRLSPLTLADVNRIQQIIVERPDSPFNSGLLATKLMPTGSVTLTPASLTQWIDGKMTKIAIDTEQFESLLAHHFGMERRGS